MYIKGTLPITGGISLKFGLFRAFVAIAVMIGLAVILDLIIYIGVTSGSYDTKITAAYDDGFSEGYSQSYDIAYHEAQNEAYPRGYLKAYEVSVLQDTVFQVSDRVDLHNPTFDELIEFLQSDTTDENFYEVGSYVCFDFAAELNNNADAAGIRAAYVRIRAQEWAHALVAFDTVDKGLVFIEPQSDVPVDLVVGQSYPWWKVGATSPMKSSDIILEIQYIW